MRVTASILVLALACWLAALVAVGATAMAAFSQLPAMDLRIEAIRPHFGDDPVEAGRWAAGHMLQPVFVIGDWVQYLAAAAAVGCTVRLARTGTFGGTRWAAMALLAVVCAAAAILAWRAWSMPAMTEDLLRMWEAVLADDRPAATAARASFETAHRAANRGMQVQLALVVLAMPLAVYALIPRRRDADAFVEQFRG